VLEELTVYYIQGLRAQTQDIVLSREYSFKDSRRSCAQGLRAYAQDIVYNYGPNLRPSRRTSAFTKLWERLNTRIESSRSRYRTQEDSNRRPLRRTSHSIGNRAPDPPSGICEYPHDPPEEQELAPNCHTIKRPPSGICEQLTDPPGEQSWHLTAPDLPPASANTPTSPPEAYRAGTWLPYDRKETP
jgi:hypothetical protein